MLSPPREATTNEGKNMTTSMMTATSAKRSTMFHNATQETERIAIHEEKKDQELDDEDNKFNRKFPNAKNSSMSEVFVS